MLTITSSLKRSLLISAALLGGLMPSAVSTPALASIALSDYDAVLTTKARTADDFYNRGIYFQGQDKLETAIDQFTQAIKRDPSNADYYFSRGLTHTDSGNHQAAQKDYSKALNLDPAFAAAYYQRGLSRIVIPVSGVTNFAEPSIASAQRENLHRAVRDFSQALQHSPNFVAAHYYRGLSHYVMGNETLARRDYQQARRLNPRIAESFYRDGFTQLHIGGPNEQR